jgi:hypothetical protein
VLVKLIIPKPIKPLNSSWIIALGWPKESLLRGDIVGVTRAKVFLYCCTVSYRSESVVAPIVAKKMEKGIIIKKSILV